MKKVPKRRFKGFLNAGDWEQRKLGEIVKIERGGSPRPIDNYITTDADGLNWIKIGDAPEQGRYIVHAAEKIKSLGLSKTRQVEPGDLILSNSMSFGKPYIMGIHGCIHDGWLLIRNNQNIFDLKFLCTLLGTEQLHAQYRRLAAGSAVNNLNKELVSGTNVGVPSKAEQLKIGQFFESIDQYITLHQRKLEKLQATKKALLYELFPIENSRRPKLRFKGFTGDWEQRKLISCIQKVIDFRGRTPNKLGMEWSCSGHLALSALNVKDGYIDFSQDNHYGDNDLYEKWMTGNELHKGQVVFTTEAPMGNVAQIPDNERYILSQRTVAFCVDENIITENFLAVLLRTPVVFKTLTKLSSGGTAQGISQKSLAEIEVRIPPNLHEQQIISNFLLSFEHCITLHQRKLEKLKNLKAAYLNEMFV